MQTLSLGRKMNLVKKKKNKTQFKGIFTSGNITAMY